MSVSDKTVHMQIVPIVIKRGQLGTIRIGPSEIEIPSEDVVLTTSISMINFTDHVATIVTAETAKQKQQNLEKEKPAETAPTKLLEWRKVEEKKKG